jgi:hypothetical protein
MKKALPGEIMAKKKASLAERRAIMAEALAAALTSLGPNAESRRIKAWLRRNFPRLNTYTPLFTDALASLRKEAKAGVLRCGTAKPLTPDERRI